jgi:hypothetical protein
VGDFGSGEVQNGAAICTLRQIFHIDPMVLKAPLVDLVVLVTVLSGSHPGDPVMRKADMTP